MTALHPFTSHQAVAMLAIQAAAVAVWYRQNRGGATRGGRIAFSKAMWLVYAVTLWFIAPLCLAINAAATGRVPALCAWALLAISMWTRGAVELWMLKQERWRVHHGILHDRLHVILIIAASPLLLIGQIGVVPLLIVALSVCSLASEITFVRWFAAATAGPQAGVYFVPDSSDNQHLLRRSFRLFLPQYVAFIGVLVWSMLAS